MSNNKYNKNEMIKKGLTLIYCVMVVTMVYVIIGNTIMKVKDGKYKTIPPEQEKEIAEAILKRIENDKKKGKA